jgi:hypothetical protein
MRSILFHAIEPDQPSRAWRIFRQEALVTIAPSEGALRLSVNAWLVSLPDYPMVVDRLAEIAKKYGLSCSILEVEHDKQWLLL